MIMAFMPAATVLCLLPRPLRGRPCYWGVSPGESPEIGLTQAAKTGVSFPPQHRWGGVFHVEAGETMERLGGRGCHRSIGVGRGASAGGGAKDAERRPSCRSQGPRSDLDDGGHNPLLRLDGLRPAVRPGCRGRLSTTAGG